MLAFNVYPAPVYHGTMCNHACKFEVMVELYHMYGHEELSCSSLLKLL